MAIAFNLPSEREASEENYSRLNRLLAELYEVLCHILVSRQPVEHRTTDTSSSEQRQRDRPFSESDSQDRALAGLPDMVQAPLVNSRRRLLSATNPGSIIEDDNDDDDVFVSPSPFGARIFGSPAARRTPAGVLLSPSMKSERVFKFPALVKEERDAKVRIASSNDEADGLALSRVNMEPFNELEDSSNADTNSSKNSILSSMLPDKLSGSICTVLLFLVGWKYFTRSR